MAGFLWRQEEMGFSTQMDPLLLGGVVSIPLTLGRGKEGWVWSVWVYVMGAGGWGSYCSCFMFCW